jgi:hypothetical protein
VTQRLRDFLVGDNIQERGFLEFRGEALAKSAVEDRVASRVCEVGKEDEIFFSEFWRAMKIKIASEERTKRRNYQD